MQGYVGRCMKDRQCGSMTVEAVIAMPAFLLLFMFMMYMVNVCTIYLTLNHAADQINKYNSNSIYVSVVVRETLKDKAQGAFEKILDEAKKEAKNSGNKNGEHDKVVVLEKVGEYLFGEEKAWFEKGELFVTEEIYKSNSKKLLKSFLENSTVKPEEVKISLFKIPDINSDKKEAEAEKDNAEGGMLAKDDLAIQLTYEMPMNLPLMGEVKFPIYAACIEKAWTKGGVKGESVSFNQKSFFTKLSE